MNKFVTAYIPVSRFVLLLFLLFNIAVVSCTKAPPVKPYVPPAPEKIEPPPEPALSTTELWRRMISENLYAPIGTKLRTVNNFFNSFEFVDDYYLWGVEDYWATLPETLMKSSGDCEDITIAKYFTLKNLNIPEENMRLTYVISVKTKKPHVVLTYQPDIRQEPVVLDTIYNYLIPVSRRNDLVPVYSFNEYGYWLAKKQEGWKGEFLGSPAKISPWWDLLTRMKMSRNNELSSIRRDQH